MKYGIALGIGLLTLATLPAFAREVPVYNWTGCYVGANVGGKWANVADDVNIPVTGSTPSVTERFRGQASTAIGGGQVGCNQQQGMWVYGFEGDADLHSWTQRYTTGSSTPSPFVPNDTFDVSSNWQGSFRGRIGKAWERSYLYVTAGLAVTNVTASSNFIATTGPVFPQTLASDTKTLFGATFGIGFEHAITDTLTFGVEGRYTGYGSQMFNAGQVAVFNFGGAPPVYQYAPATQAIQLSTLEITARLNWHFGWRPSTIMGN